MSADLPSHYFRIRENGAAVFRVDSDNRDRRIELQEIAFVNLKSGAVRPHGDALLADIDREAIALWLEERRALIQRREREDIARVIEQLNGAAQWAGTRASDEDLAEVTDALLLAMHDLRSTLVRRKAESLTRR